jgi:mRNA-degrading endonuclease YafQ of YafQ-DinJ toxin-antitoxin module
MTAVDVLGMYLHLARASAMRRRYDVKDRFLVLAACLADQMNLSRIAEECRRRVLAHNRHHILGRWPSVRDARHDPDFLVFLRRLERRYPLERVELLLEKLGIHWRNERAAYFSDEEYAASLLGPPCNTDNAS